MSEKIKNDFSALGNKRYNATINDVEISVLEPKQTGKSLLKEADIKNVECVDLFQIIGDGEFERISLDEIVDLSSKGAEKFITKLAEFLSYKVNNDPETTDKKSLTANEILKNAGLNPEEHFLIEVKSDGTKISYARKGDTHIRITCPPLKFITERVDTVCDIEKCCDDGVIPFVSYRYVIKINSEKFTVDEKEMTGRQILSLINQTPESYYLRFKHKGGSSIVAADEVIDFTTCGVERFSAKAKNCTEGRVNKRDFFLSEEDVNFFNKTLYEYDCHNENGQWVIIREFNLPKGYNVEKCDVAILIPANYPSVALDMFYMFPALSRTDHQVIGALSFQTIEGKNYQRWSRHRTSENPWVPGEDNLETHIELMNHSLNEEFKKR